MLALLKEKHFNPSGSVDRQVAAHVRDLIQRKKLAVHDRLPPMRTLAELWDTNYSTVQNALTRLVGEGLLVQSPKKGTFVAAPRRALRRACLYHLGNLDSATQNFYSQLNIRLYGILSQRGVVTVPYFDHRPYERLHVSPPEIRDMAQDGEIDAVIATRINYEQTSWLPKLEVPVTSPMLNPPFGAYIDYKEMARLAVDEALRKKKQAIALIMPPLDPRPGEASLRELVQRRAEEYGLQFIYLGDQFPELKIHEERFAFLACERLLKMKLPDCLVFVFPDALIRGVSDAMLRHRVSVPDKIAIASHRNFENSIYLPVPVTWMTVKIDDFAHGLVKQIEWQISGRKLRPVTIAVSREDG